jgi:hypothetical protein
MCNIVRLNLLLIISGFTERLALFFIMSKMLKAPLLCKPCTAFQIQY